MREAAKGNAADRVWIDGRYSSGTDNWMCARKVNGGSAKPCPFLAFSLEPNDESTGDCAAMRRTGDYMTFGTYCDGQYPFLCMREITE